eukprot:6515242-Pyramimonas_sp.AAC.1
MVAVLVLPMPGGPLSSTAFLGASLAAPRPFAFPPGGFRCAACHPLNHSCSCLTCTHGGGDHMQYQQTLPSTEHVLRRRTATPTWCGLCGASGFVTAHEGNLPCPSTRLRWLMSRPMLSSWGPWGDTRGYYSVRRTRHPPSELHSLGEGWMRTLRAPALR